MTYDEMKALFDKHNDKYINFETYVKNPRSMRPDLHAFMLIDSLLPGKRDLISAAEHDVFYLDVTLEQFAQVVTEADIIELIASGIRLESQYDCFAMFS